MNNNTIITRCEEEDKIEKSFGVERERELFLLSGSVVKVSKRVEQNNNREHAAEEKKQNFSLFSLFPFLLFHFCLFFSILKVSLVSSQQKTALSVALVFILSAGRTSHLSEHSLERTHHHAQRHPLCCSAFLQYY